VEPTPGAAWLVAGLGNPGPAYRATRHNLGFAVVDRLAAEGRCRFRAGRHAVEAARLILAGVPVALLKPQTFMNCCGPAVAAWLAGLGLPAERLLVVHDDLDLGVGRLRLTAGGGAGGHRGVASIQAAVGTREIPRVRLGIGRPPDGLEAADFVLRPCSAEERPELEAATVRAAEAVRDIMLDGLAVAMQRHNARPKPGGGAEGADEPVTDHHGAGGR
jgi:PTH1 family peptidyl-tRNA hydrolase